MLRDGVLRSALKQKETNRDSKDLVTTLAEIRTRRHARVWNIFQRLKRVIQRVRVELYLQNCAFIAHRVRLSTIRPSLSCR